MRIKISDLEQKLQDAINDIDFENLCENQRETLVKALVMLQVKWSGIYTTNLNCTDTIIDRNPNWNWSIFNYQIIQPKRMIPLDWSDALEILKCGEVKSIQSGDIFKIYGIKESGVYLEGYSFYNYIYFNEYFTRLDGTRFEKEEVE